MIAKIIRKLSRIKEDLFPTTLSNETLKARWHEWNKEGYQDGMSHKFHGPKYRETVDFMAPVLAAGMRVHEIGCGQGGNLQVIAKEYPKIAISGNDLSRESCYRFMEEDFKKRLTFIEADTLNYLRGAVKRGEQVDVLLVTDHLMHLSREIIEEVYRLMAGYSSKWIFVREPYGVVRQMQGSSDKRILLSGDVFDDKFPGFKLLEKVVSAQATPEKNFTLMKFGKA